MPFPRPAQISALLAARQQHRPVGKAAGHGPTVSGQPFWCFRHTWPLVDPARMKVVGSRRHAGRDEQTETTNRTERTW
jgi:hypothetical protein